MMPIINCRRCGRLYNQFGRDLCSECLKAEDEAYKLVRTYLRRHQDVYMSELAEGTDVPEEWIVEMIRDGRLILRDHPNLSTACERCGAPTQAGHYCPQCAKELHTSFSSVSKDMHERAEKTPVNRIGYYSKSPNNKKS